VIPGGLTFDAGALIAVDRGDERIVALIRAARTAGLPIEVPAGALAQVWRDGRRQARLAGLLRVRSGAPNVVVLDARTARAAGELCGRAGTADVVDASVVLCAGAKLPHLVLHTLPACRRYPSDRSEMGLTAVRSTTNPISERSRPDHA
jgi:hypothetical protein